MTKECYVPWTNANQPLQTKQCVDWDETKTTCLKNEPCPRPWEDKDAIKTVQNVAQAYDVTSSEWYATMDQQGFVYLYGRDPKPWDGKLWYPLEVKHGNP